MRIRVALYIRVSTTEQASDGYSVRAQEARLREWVERDDFEVVEVVADEGFSGREANRKGLRRILQLATQDRIDAVLTWKRDRMFRSLQHRRNHEEILKEYGVRLLATDDTGNRIADTVLDAVAEEESERISARSREGLLQKALEGRIIRGMKAPYGFVSAGEKGGSLEVFEPEMLVVRRILRAVGDEGMSAHATAGLLDLEGFKPPLAAEAERRGKNIDVATHWSQNTIRNLIHSDLYRPHEPEEVERLVSPDVAARLEEGHVYGLWTWNRRKTSKKLLEDGETYLHHAEVRPKSEWLHVPVDVTGAGLDRDRMDAARGRLKKRATAPSKAAGRVWPLRGLVRCPDCGSVLSPQTITRKKGDGTTARTYYYSCRRRFNSSSRRDCDYRKNWPAEELEGVVWEKVSGWMTNPTEIVRGLDRLIAREREDLASDPGEEERRWLDRINAIDGRIDRLQDAALEGVLEGVFDRDRLERKVRELHDQRSAAQDSLRAARGRGERIQSLEALKDSYLRRGKFWEMFDAWGKTEGWPLEEWHRQAEGGFRRGMAEDLNRWTPEERHAHYRKLGLDVGIDGDGEIVLRGELAEEMAFVSPDNTSWRR